jgi:hypothetical protein
MGLRGHAAATTVSDTTPSGEAPGCVVGVGLDFQAVIEDGVEGAGGRDPGNGPIRLLHARCGTKPNSDKDHGGFPPVHSVLCRGRARCVSG